MPITSTSQAGPAVVSDGAQPPLRSGKAADLIISELQGRYYEQTYRGLTFNASNQAAQAVSVALTTTYTGLCISNPLGNTKNVVILSASYALAAAPAAIASLHLIGGYSATANVTHTTPLVAPGIQNGLLGTGPASTVKADSAATIVNPGYLFPLIGGFTAAALPSSPVGFVDLGGQIVLPPGGWIAIGALTAVSGFGSFSWVEVPV